MSKIDFHFHCDSGKAEDLAFLAKQVRANDLKTVLIGELHHGTPEYLPNDQVLSVCKKYPDCFIPVVKFDLGESVDADQIRRFGDAGFRAIKFIYPFHEYDHDLYMPVYQACEERKLPVLFHTGNIRPSEEDVRLKRKMLCNMDPLTLDRVARSFPNLNIVMAHLGTTLWRVQAAELLKIHPNLYSDLAGCGSWQALSAEELNQLLRPLLFLRNTNDEYFNKLVFGSDGYSSIPSVQTRALAHYEAILTKSGISQATCDAVMGGTVAKWLA